MIYLLAYLAWSIGYHYLKNIVLVFQFNKRKKIWKLSTEISNFCTKVRNFAQTFCKNEFKRSINISFHFSKRIYPFNCISYHSEKRKQNYNHFLKISTFWTKIPFFTQKSRMIMKYDIQNYFNLTRLLTSHVKFVSNPKL